MISHHGKVKNATAMKNPVHPGQIVRRDCLKTLGLSVTDGAGWRPDASGRRANTRNTCVTASHPWPVLAS